MAEHTRAEAVASAAAWAAEADKHANDFRAGLNGADLDHMVAEVVDLRDQARDMALMWARVAEVDTASLDQLRAARNRTLQHMNNYIGAGYDSVEPKRVIELLALNEEASHG